MSNANYVIVTSDGRYFSGWNLLGEITLTKEKSLGYRLSRTVASNNIGKIEAYSKQKCQIVPSV